MFSMASQKDEVSELGETEDIPSDFFDDFTKEEFMEGLSVVDECWEDVNGSASQKRSRFKDALDSVKDLRELISDSCDGSDTKGNSKKKSKDENRSSTNDKYRWRKPPEALDLDSFIKPGSRRDPSKTNQAIKKDKEVKVKEFLAKSLESSDELRPPGTELEDYYNRETKKMDTGAGDFDTEKKPSPSPQQSRRSPRPRHSPRSRRSPRSRISPRTRISPRARISPRSRISPRTQSRVRYSPRRSPYRSSRNLGPLPYNEPRPYNSKRHHSPHRRSPVRHSPRRYSPRRRSPRRQLHRSKSPRRRDTSRRSRSRSPCNSDNFLYPLNPEGFSGNTLANPSYPQEPIQQYAPFVHPEFSGNVSGFYAQAPAYDSGFTDPYGYGVPQVTMVSQVPSSGPVMIPNVTAPAAPPMVPAAPPMVPAPTTHTTDKATPYDALAQLVAEGKISQEDYLKLTPHKGANTGMDPKTKLMVLSRCKQALKTLEDKLFLPNRLVINNQMIGAEDKCIAPKYCSPLKRLAAAELTFTKGSITSTQQTKQLVESIISTLGLDKVISKYKKRLPKDMKDAVIQTTKPHCEVCEIRETIKYHDASTSTEPEYFTSTVHTQVVEEDLISSKSIFNPSGSVGEGAAISIAHLTPAQLVSQLAARAKTLKQPQETAAPPSQFSRRPSSNYDYDNRGGQYHHSYNNYRY